MRCGAIWADLSTWVVFSRRRLKPSARVTGKLSDCFHHAAAATRIIVELYCFKPQYETNTPARSSFGSRAHAEVFRGPGGDWNASALVACHLSCSSLERPGFVGRALTLQAAARDFHCALPLDALNLNSHKDLKRRRFRAGRRYRMEEALEGVP